MVAPSVCPMKSVPELFTELEAPKLVGKQWRRVGRKEAASAMTASPRKVNLQLDCLSPETAAPRTFRVQLDKSPRSVGLELDCQVPVQPGLVSGPQVIEPKELRETRTTKPETTIKPEIRPKSEAEDRAWRQRRMWKRQRFLDTSISQWCPFLPDPFVRSCLPDPKADLNKATWERQCHQARCRLRLLRFLHRPSQAQSADGKVDSPSP